MTNALIRPAWTPVTIAMMIIGFMIFWPLGLAMLAYILFGDRLDESGLIYLDRMEDASSRMRSLISELLNYSRITTKEKTFEAVDLNALVDGVLNDLEVGIENSGAKVPHADLPTIEAEFGIDRGGVLLHQCFDLCFGVIAQLVAIRAKELDPVVMMRIVRG